MSDKKRFNPFSWKVVGGLIAILFIGTSLYLNDKSAPPLTATETYKYVSYTPQTVEAEEAVMVRFINPLPDELQKKIVTNHLISYSPKIEGDYEWINNQIIKLTPKQSLKSGERYRGRIRLEDIFNTAIEDYHFYFDVPFQSIQKCDGYAKIQENPKYFVYHGTITTQLKTTKQKLQDALSLERAKEKLPLEIEQLSDFNFTFKSPKLEIDSADRDLVIRFNKEALSLQKEIVLTYNLDNLIGMSVQNIKTRYHYNRSRIEIEFSQPIAIQQTIEGLVSITPKVDSVIKKSGNKIIVDGRFKRDQHYTLEIEPSLQNIYGETLKTPYKKTIQIESLAPELSFTSGGVFLPNVANQKLRFKAVNIPKVTVTIEKIYENNIPYHLQYENLKSSATEYHPIYDVHRLGEKVAEKEIKLTQTGDWDQYEIDLDEFFKAEPGALYNVEIFNNYRLRIAKPLIFSDIALTYEKCDGLQHVQAIDITTLKPVSNAKITLKTFQNQVIETGSTDTNGVAVFKTNVTPFLIEAEKNQMLGFLKPNEMKLNFSTFDIDGQAIGDNGIRTFIYTDRGVYRPGDTIHLTLIARDKTHSWPDKNTVTLKLLNPKNQEVFQTKQAQAIDGVYVFQLTTEPTDLTGSYQAILEVGSKKVYYPIEIETVVPTKIKTTLTTSKDHMDHTDGYIDLTIASSYLFGAPAKELEFKLYSNLFPFDKQFKHFPDFIFTQQHKTFSSEKTEIAHGTLSDNGTAKTTWQPKGELAPPSALLLNFEAAVIEKGGRFIRTIKQIPYDVYPSYVGIKLPKTDYGYFETNHTIPMEFVIVDPNGTPLKDQKLHYKIFQNTKHWWWEYNSFEDFKLHYKSNQYTELITQGDVVSSEGPISVDFNPQKSGHFFIEVSAENSDHKATTFFKVSHWGDTLQDENHANTLTLRTDKPTYEVGETANVSFPTPQEGIVLVKLIKGQHVLKSYMKPIEKGNDTMTLSIPVTTEMLPNAYVAVSIVQTYQNTQNDRPIRMMGIIPILAKKEATKLKFDVTMPNVVESGESFSIELQTQDKTPAQFTVAVVDEGLLQITGFQMPNAWDWYYKKEKLSVDLYDNFNFFINAFTGDILQSFSIGGDLAKKSKQMIPTKANRFKPVAMFEGPIQTDKNGKATVAFKMPEYIGSVRVMVMGIDKERFGNTVQNIAVKKDIMLLPSIPRVLSPNDDVTIPVSVFWGVDEPGNLNINITTEGPISVKGDSLKSIQFNKKSEQDLAFQLTVLNEVGVGKITITATDASGRKSVVSTEIAIRPINPSISTTVEKTLHADGKTQSLSIPSGGITGSNEASIHILRHDINIDNRLNWLIKYPYGCIEQTTSAVFPQLYLNDIKQLTPDEKKKVQDNINAGLARLETFQTSSGGFSYWPYGYEPSDWGTNYAGHFILYAKKQGYYVSQTMLSSWKNYQYLQAEQFKNPRNKTDLSVQVYRLYLLALASNPNISAMNYIKESHFNSLNNLQKWLLASAYQLAGNDAIAQEIAAHTSTDIEFYKEFAGTYGSVLRDQAMILEASLSLGLDNTKLFEKIGKKINSNTWYSTQTLGYSLMALGRYIQSTMGQDDQKMKGSIQFPNGEVVSFNTSTFSFEQPIQSGFGEDLQVKLDADSAIQKVYAKVNWTGIPEEPISKETKKGLELKKQFFNESGDKISPNAIQQGHAFWMVLTVSKSEPISISELALVQLLPSGWEIENTRLTQEKTPRWLQSSLSREEYLDIRDDRVMWFFDMNTSQKEMTYAIKLNAVSVGTYDLPPSLVEAMYDNDYQAILPGKRIQVLPR